MTEKKTTAGRGSKRTRRKGRKQKLSSASLEGILVLDAGSGKVVASKDADGLFNPASNIKVATALCVLEKHEPEHLFKTEIRVSGQINANKELQGDLYVKGNYMLFGDRQAKELARILNARGIEKVKGRLYVSSDFSMNLHATGIEAAKRLLLILDPRSGLSSAQELLENNEGFTLPLIATVSIAGDPQIGDPPAQSQLLATHNSPPLKDLLKIMLCYSDNTMAERFGSIIGGARGLERFLTGRLGISPREASLASTSGLGVNRVSPQAMLTVLQSLRTKLSFYNLSFTDLLAVAGVDDGTLKNRLNAFGQRGSVAAKTGTLIQTDRGASALCGEISTTGDGSFLFAIFHMVGDVPSFRKKQDEIVTAFQKEHGGAKSFPYTPILPGIDSKDYWS